MDWLDTVFSAAQQWLFESAVQPLMFALGLGHLLEDGYAATGWLLVGIVQIPLMLLIRHGNQPHEVFKRFFENMSVA